MMAHEASLSLGRQLQTWSYFRQLWGYTFIGLSGTCVRSPHRVVSLAMSRITGGLHGGTMYLA